MTFDRNQAGRASHPLTIAIEFSPQAFLVTGEDRGKSHGAIGGTVTPLDIHGVTRHPNGAEPPLDGSFVPAIHEIGIDSIEVSPTTSTPLPHNGG